MIMDWLTVLVLAGTMTPGAAQDTTAEPLPLGAVVASAVRTHPSVAAATARLDGATAEAGQAHATRWPTLAVTALGTRYQEPMVVAPLHGFDIRNPPRFDETLYQGHASAEYTLFDGGARGARIRAASARTAAARSATAAARDAVMAEAITSYLEALSARGVRTAHALQVEALEAERGRARLLLREGKAARVVLLRADAALSEAVAGLEAADEQLRLALHRLVRVSGLPPERVTADALVSVRADDEPPPPRAALVARALEANPRLSGARDGLAAATTAVDVARAAFLPRIELSGRYSAFGSASDDPVLEWQTGLQVSYPVFMGGARSHGVERAEAASEVAAAELREAERSVADAVDVALVAYRSARARVTALEAAVAQSAEVARIEALALDAGAGVQTDYLRAEAALLRARAGLAEARHAAVAARVRLAQVTGRLDEAWLARLTEEVER